jgi:hypothetical protein
MGGELPVQQQSDRVKLIKPWFGAGQAYIAISAISAKVWDVVPIAADGELRQCSRPTCAANPDRSERFRREAVRPLPTP